MTKPLAWAVVDKDGVVAKSATNDPFLYLSELVATRVRSWNDMEETHRIIELVARDAERERAVAELVGAAERLSADRLDDDARSDMIAAIEKINGAPK